jgi:signal transduction histidine kinase
VTLARHRLLVAAVVVIVGLAVSTTGGSLAPGTWVGLASVAVAAAAALMAAPRSGLLALTALALVLGSLADLDDPGVVGRWLALAALPTVAPLASAVLVSKRSARALLAVAGLLAGPVRAIGYDPLLDPACTACEGLFAPLGMSTSAASVLALVGGLMTLAALLIDLPAHKERIWLVAMVVASSWAVTGWDQPRGTVPAAAALAAIVVLAESARSMARIGIARVRLDRLAAALAAGQASEAGDGLPDARLTAELRLAVEHARLTARLEAQVRELAASRVRVVEAADEARRRLERDLHDGAQQELLALGFDLRRALAAAPGDPGLTACVDELTRALADLRSLASGVHPALLTSAGLAPALERVSGLSPHDVHPVQLPDQRFAPAVERTVYLLVLEMARQGPVGVHGAVTDGRLRLSVTGRPVSRHSVVRERVAALGGILTVGPDSTEVTLPCG